MSEIKDFIPHSTRIMSLIVTLVFLAPLPHLFLPGQCRMAQINASPSGLVSQLRNPKLRKPGCLFFYNELQANIPPFVLEGHCLYYAGNQTIFPYTLEGVIVSTFQRFSLKNILEKILWNKICQCLCVQEVQKYETHGELSSNNIFGRILEAVSRRLAFI